jgi:hypothetical protein
MTLNAVLTAPKSRLRYRGLTPAEWLRLDHQLPEGLQLALVDDHADLTSLLHPSASALHVLDWAMSANAESFTQADREVVEHLRQTLHRLGVAA